MSRFYPAAQRAQLGRECVGQSLGAALSDGPADPVRAQREHDSEGRWPGCATTASSGRSSRPAAHARARPRSASGRSRCRAEGARGEARRSSGWRGGRSGPRISRAGSRRLRTADRTAAGRPARPAEAAGRLLHRALQQHRGAVVEGMGQGASGCTSSSPCCASGRLLRKATRAPGVDGGAGVVHEAGQGQLLGAAAAADVRRPRAP